METYELRVNQAEAGAGAMYATLDEAKAAGRLALVPTAEEEEAPGSFLDSDAFFAVHRVAAHGRDTVSVYDSRWPT